MRYFLLLLLLLNVFAYAQEWEFTADSIKNERELQTTIAEGDVVVEQAIESGKRRLEADKVIYNRKDNIVTAIGNVRLWDEQKSYYEADYIEVSGDFKHAVIEKLELQLHNFGILKSERAKREEHISTFTKPSYSACKVCVDKPDNPLLWELRAGKVIHNQEQQLLKYYNTHLRFAGIPVFYLPYFQHADPTVDRKDGFLLPSIGSNRNIGSFISTPYFITLGDYADLTLNPIFTTKGGQILSSSFRKNWRRATFKAETSYAEAERTRGEINNARLDKNSNRWHVDLQGEFRVNDLWRSGFNVNRASDKNYFRRYSFWGDRGNFLQSKFYAERFDKRDYINITAYAFQDLRLDVGSAGEAPKVLPNIDAYFHGDIDSFGGMWNTYSNLRLLDKSKLVDDRRAYTRATYEIPYYAEHGSVIRGKFNLYGLAKSSDFDSPRNSFNANVDDGESARIMPQVGFVWQYPLHRQAYGASQIIEPVIATYVGGDNPNERNIDNRDANVYALDSHNIFLPHRFNGVDRFDGGQRIAYGIKGGHYAESMNLRTFIGQSYEFNEDEVLRSELGITEGSSPIVLAALTSVDTNSFFGTINIDNQIQLDNSDYKIRRGFTQASIGTEDFNFQANYLFQSEGFLDPKNRTADNRIEEQEQVSFTANKALSQNWRGSVFATFDYGEKAVGESQTRNYGSSLTYDDECFNFSITGSRDFSRNPDLEDGYSVVLSFSLKTLTGIVQNPAEAVKTLSGF